MPHFAEILTELDVSLHNLALLQLKSFANFQLVTFSVGKSLICTLITFPTLIYSQRKFHDARLFASLRLFDGLEYCVSTLESPFGLGFDLQSFLISSFMHFFTLLFIGHTK